MHIFPFYIPIMSVLSAFMMKDLNDHHHKESSLLRNFYLSFFTYIIADTLANWEHCSFFKKLSLNILHNFFKEIR